MSLTPAQLAIWKALTETSADGFEDLVRLAGLDPALDFQGADLTAVDFGTADLRSYDFSGADLSGADLSRARVVPGALKDATTIGARLPPNLQRPSPVSAKLLAVLDLQRDHARRALVTAPPGAGLRRLVDDLLFELLGAESSSMALIITPASPESARFLSLPSGDARGGIRGLADLAVGAPAARTYVTEYEVCVEALRADDSPAGGVIRSGGFKYVMLIGADTAENDVLRQVLAATRESTQIAFAEQTPSAGTLQEHFAGAYILDAEPPVRPGEQAELREEILDGSFDADPGPRLREDGVSQSTLLLTFGPRATRIGRTMRVPDWSPAYGTSGYRDGGIVRSRTRQRSWPPWVEIRDGEETRIMPRETDDFGVVVVLADEVVLAHPSQRDRAVDAARLLAAKDGIVIIAPALPEDLPSAALQSEDALTGFGADFVLDTSLARSPMWGTTERQSLDRRIGDLVLGTAMACVPGSQIYKLVAERRGKPGMARIAKLAVWDEQEFGDTYDGGDTFASEAGSASSLQVWLDEFIPVNSRQRRLPAVRFAIGRWIPDFDAYAHAVLRRLEQRRQIRHGELWPMPFEAPGELRAALRHPELAAAFRVPGPTADYCALTAETPSVHAIEVAHRHQWFLARATDASGIRRLAMDHDHAPMPTEVLLPPLRRFLANRRLATRGADPRDIVRVPRFSPERDDVEHHAAMRSMARPFFTGPAEFTPPPGDGRDEVALPVAELERMSDRDALAEHLLRRYRTRGATARRLADLSILWNPPALRRFVIEDGRLPTNVLELRPEVVPAQTWFVIDGDDAVPVILGSRLFGVWARMTRSRGTGWTQRFAVSRTFETFPLIAPFETIETPTGGLALVETLTKHFARYSRVLAPRLGDAAAEHPDEHSFASARAQADAELLQIYGLPSDAPEVHIAQRLLDMNSSLPDEPPAPQPTLRRLAAD